MRIARVLGATLLLGAAGLTGRAQEGGSPQEAVIKEMLTALDKMTAILGQVKDAATASESRPALKKAVADFLAIRKKAEGLRQPDQQERDRLEKAYAKKLAEAVTKLREEITRVGGIPGGREALREIAALEEITTGRPPGSRKK